MQPITLAREIAFTGKAFTTEVLLLTMFTVLGNVSPYTLHTCKDTVKAKDQTTLGKTH